MGLKKPIHMHKNIKRSKLQSMAQTAVATAIDVSRYLPANCSQNCLRWRIGLKAQ